jgi:hypothetical protein
MDATTLHDHHRALFALMRRLTEDLQQEAPPAEALADQARALGMALKHHFDQERGSLYGRLLRDPDPTTRALAQICRTEADASERALEAFVRQWTVPLHIARDPEAFRLAATGLFAQVGRRVGLEERELAPRLSAAS